MVDLEGKERQVTWLVFDTEIKLNPEDVPGGFGATDSLGLSCAVVYDMGTDRYTIYDDRPESLAELKKQLLSADRVTGFNSWAFDLPLLWETPKVHWMAGQVSDAMRSDFSRLKLTSDDLLRRIWIAQRLDPNVFIPKFHGGWGLDNVCQGTLRRGKTGNGAQAPKLYQEARWGELISYCLNDVQLTADLARHVEKYGQVYNEYKGQLLRIPAWVPNSPQS